MTVGIKWGYLGCRAPAVPTGHPIKDGGSTHSVARPACAAFKIDNTHESFL